MCCDLRKKLSHMKQIEEIKTGKLKRATNCNEI